MKNITLRIDDAILFAARRYAIERNSSVNALVREYLVSIATGEDRLKNARQRIRELSEQSPVRIGARNWTRDDLHER